MNIKVLEDSIEIANVISNLIVENIKLKPDLLLCAATGNTPTETYRQLIEKKELYPSNQLRILKLDEWGGVPMDNPETCESYLERYILKPLNIPESNYFGFNSNAANPEHEIQRMKTILYKQDPIDICILGLGLNGHIAFNEPPCEIDTECHVATLSKQSLLHPMVTGMSIKPGYGLTLGIKEIMQSKKIFIIVTGEHKQKIAKEFLSGKVSKNLPASYLWLHPNAYCFIDQKATNQ
ncbi:6-phosphogluconolactonase [Reichenbachiella sp. MALMAid0571]|uniref:6-phosphogluconolactonase n=1 Tax=Reichenbachiella sp. MALMAid0571 TaxID=3143939 RepID=UPI0032DF8ABB